MGRCSWRRLGIQNHTHPLKSPKGMMDLSPLQALSCRNNRECSSGEAELGFPHCSPVEWGASAHPKSSLGIQSSSHFYQRDFRISGPLLNGGFWDLRLEFQALTSVVGEVSTSWSLSKIYTNQGQKNKLYFLMTDCVCVPHFVSYSDVSVHL